MGQRKMNNKLVKALARALRWERVQELGEVTTISENGRARGDRAILHYPRPAPRSAHRTLSKAILDGRQEPEVTLARLLEPFPVEWVEQLVHFR